MAGYLIALLSIPTGVLFMIGVAATLLAAVWLLESLELDEVDREPRCSAPIEPAARRSASRCRRDRQRRRSCAAEGGFGAMRLSVADQIALSRSTRERRNRWQAGQDARPAAATPRTEARSPRASPHSSPSGLARR